MYCTAAQYEELYGADERQQLTDRERTGLADETVYEGVEAGVRSLINDYLLAPGSRVDHASIPFSDPPDRIVQVAAAIIRYRLFGVSRSDAVKEDYKEAMDYLKQVSRGDIVPGGVAAAETARASYGESAVVSAGQVFNRDTSFI
jgi:phage gp36-like protein